MAQVELFQAGEVLAEVAIDLRDLIVLQVQDQKRFEGLALKAEGLGNGAQTAVLQEQLLLQADLFKHCLHCFLKLLERDVNAGC